MNTSDFDNLAIEEQREVLKDASPEARDSLITNSDHARAVWFWEENPTKSSLLQKINHLSKLNKHVPLLPEELVLRGSAMNSSIDPAEAESDEEIDLELEVNLVRMKGRNLYRSLFIEINETDQSKMTTTERYLFGYAKGMGASFSDRYMEGPYAYQNVSLLQALGSLDEETKKLRLQQAKQYKDLILERVGGRWDRDVVLNDLTAEQREDLITNMVNVAREVLNIPQTIKVTVSSEPHSEKGVRAHLKHESLDSLELVVFPPAFEVEPIALIGTIIHECLHAKHKSEAIDGMDDRVKYEAQVDRFEESLTHRLPPSRAAQNLMTHLSMEAGKIVNVDTFMYPMKLQHEYEAWMLQTAIQIYAANDPAFALGGNEESLNFLVYRGIGVEELEKKGPEGRLAAYAKSNFQLDMDKLASLASEQMTSMDLHDSIAATLQALRKMKESVKNEQASNKVNVYGPLSELRNDLLRTIPSMLSAAQDAGHPAHEDAKLLVLAIDNALWLRKPAKSLDLEDVAKLSEQQIILKCQQKASQLKSTFGRALLYTFGLEMLGIERPRTGEERKRCEVLREAIGLPPEIGEIQAMMREQQLRPAVQPGGDFPGGAEVSSPQQPHQQASYPSTSQARIPAALSQALLAGMDGEDKKILNSLVQLKSMQGKYEKDRYYLKPATNGMSIDKGDVLMTTIIRVPGEADTEENRKKNTCTLVRIRAGGVLGEQILVLTSAQVQNLGIKVGHEFTGKLNNANGVGGRNDAKQNSATQDEIPGIRR